MNALKELVASLIVSTLTSFDSMVADARNILTGSGTVFNADSIWNSMMTISNALKPFCYILIGICLLISFAQEAARVDTLKWETAIKLGVKMALARVCIDVAPTFMRACYVQAATWISSIGGRNVTLGNLVAQRVSTLMRDINNWQAIGLLATIGIVAIAIKICGIMVQAIAFGRMFELYIYVAVSPLPCAFFPLGEGGGFSRTTQNFFKAFAAVCLQGVMMIICFELFGLIVSGSIATLAGSVSGAGSVQISELCYTMLLGAIVLVMSVGKCGSWAKSILNAM